MTSNSRKKLYQTIVDKDVACRLRDGTILYSDIYRPNQEGRFPVILHRTPYDKDNVALGIGVQIHPLHAACHGYVAIVQDVRGRFTSEGKFNVFTNEAEDGYDTIQWAAGLPYSNGRVGMFGGSYTGVTQILAASAKPSQLIAISPRQTGSNYYHGWAYQGGAYLLAFNVLWSIELAMDELNRTSLPRNEKKMIVEELAHASDDLISTCSQLPLEQIDLFRKYDVASYFYDWLAHPTYDDFWKQIDAERHYEEMSGIAGLHIGGWYDIFLTGTIKNYLRLRDEEVKKCSQSKQKLIIGPWVHGTGLTNLIGEWNSGLLSQGDVMGIEAIQFGWFDHWLKSLANEIMEEPRVMIFVMGENKWRFESKWPLESTRYTRFYLHSHGNANTSDGDGILSVEGPTDEPSDTYVYEPLNPVPTRGGATTGSMHASLPDGVFDQRAIEKRNDVLVYTSEPMSHDIEVTGRVQVMLWASSSQPDTDFTAKLNDVHPDGYARNLCDGIIRARYRESYEAPKLMKPGRAYLFAIDLVATSNLFVKGHLIRLELSSSNFPKFDRNPNTGRQDYSENQTTRAVQTIYHNAQYPSYVILPLIPRAT